MNTRFSLTRSDMDVMIDFAITCGRKAGMAARFDSMPCYIKAVDEYHRVMEHSAAMGVSGVEDVETLNNTFAGSFYREYGAPCMQCLSCPFGCTHNSPNCKLNRENGDCQALHTKAA